jgi:L-iditol 2-dehydrogenase
MKHNRGWLFSDIRHFELVENDIPQPAPNEVVLRVLYAGICGSDLHAYLGEHPLVKPGLIPGHEVTGEVHAVGEEVKGLQQGDRVVIEPNVACGECYNCLRGRYNICAHLQVIGTVGINGGFQQYMIAPADRLHVVNELSPDIAILAEPFAVSVHAVRTSGFRPGDEVMVIGAGPIGIFTALFLSFSGARKIVVTDVLEQRLEFLKKMVPRIETVSAQRFDSTSYFMNGGPDQIFDCVGIDATVNTAIQQARKGTEIVLAGVPPQESKVELIYVQDRELRITGTLMYVQEDFLTAIERLEAGEVDYSQFITQRFSFEELPGAFEWVLNNKDQTIKPLVTIQED